MSVQTKYYLGMPGNFSIVDPAIANTTILAVTRSGATYYRSVVNPTNMQFKYTVASGKILFQNAFNGPAPDLPVSLADLEPISVKFKT